MRSSLAAEIEVLATQLDRIAQLDRHTADFTRAAMREAIREVIACFPVYRTYISHRGVSDEDRRIVHWAVNVARKRSAGAELSVFDFLRDVLLGERGEGKSESVRRAMLEFAMKFQQVTAPVTAKGVEDTAFYRYNRLVCLNEVGGDPGRFGTSSAALHQANSERARVVAARDARDLDARHEAQRRRARAHRRAQRAAGSVEAAPRALDPLQPQQAPAGRRRSGAGPRGRVPALSDADRRVVADGGSPRRSSSACRRTRSRRRARPSARRRGSRRTRSTRKRSAISSRELLGDPERSAFLQDFRTLARNRGVLRAHQLAGADRAQDRLAGRARFLPGHGADRR